MREINFVRDLKLHEARHRVHLNFMEGVEKTVQKQFSRRTDKMLLIEASSPLPRYWLFPKGRPGRGKIFCNLLRRASYV